MWKLLLSILETNYAELTFFPRYLLLVLVLFYIHFSPAIGKVHRKWCEGIKSFNLKDLSQPSIPLPPLLFIHEYQLAYSFLKTSQHLIFISWKQPCQYLFQTYKIISTERSQACPLISQNQRAVFHSSHLTFLVITLLLHLPRANWVTQNHKYYHSAIGNVYLKVPDF